MFFVYQKIIREIMNATLGLFLSLILALPIILHVNFAPVFQEFLAKVLPVGVENNQEFDFIVIGAGSAGSVVAGRLAEAGHDVLLVEAGGPANWLMGIPALVGSFQLGSYDWQYKTESQDTLDLHKISNWPRGKVLGGSSQLNYMLYVRGNPKDYDEWAAFGNPGWSYKEVLPFFKKSQRIHDGKADPEYQGTDGMMGVKQFKDDEVWPLVRVYEQAWSEMGFAANKNYNGENQDGVYRGQMNLKPGGWRADSYSSFAEPFLGKGLTVLTHSQATKLLIENKSKRVTGVEISRFGKVMNIKAKKEVILSGGAINSPQLLMLSGIGPKQQLKDHGIELVRDAPGVGENLQDHLVSFNSIKVQSDDDGIMAPRKLGADNFFVVNPVNYFKFLTGIGGRGPLQDSGIAVGAFVHTKANRDKKYNRPDIQIHTVGFGFDVDFGLGFKQLLNFNDELFHELFGDDTGR